MLAQRSPVRGKIRCLVNGGQASRSNASVDPLKVTRNLFCITNHFVAQSEDLLRDAPPSPFRCGNQFPVRPPPPAAETGLESPFATKVKTATLHTMLPQSLIPALGSLPLLCGPRPDRLQQWMAQPTGARLLACFMGIFLGGMAYGFTLGMWRAPLMGFFVGVKLPLLIGLTLLTNGLINGMLAQVLGSGLSFRQTLMAMLLSFATFALITGALSPIAFFFIWNAPEPGSMAGGEAHSAILLAHTIIIAFAGFIAFRRFLPVLQSIANTRRSAHLVLAAWLAGNLLVGAQLSWNLRPFFGQPGRPVEFIRPDWNHSSFYESVLHHLLNLINRYC